MAFRTERVAVPLQSPGRASASTADLRLPAGAHAPYAAAVAGLGVLLLTSRFVNVWAPIPKWVAWRHELTLAAGALMLAAAAGLLWRQTVVLSSAVLTLLLHHFADVKGAAEAVPAWLPVREAWAYATGAGHVAAGMALLVGIIPRVAATLEAIMITAFVMLVHVPGVLGAPADPLQWTMLVVAAAIGGAAWIVALAQRQS